MSSSYQGLIGVAFLLLFSWSISSARSRINWRTVGGGLALQVVLGLLLLKTSGGRRFFEGVSVLVGSLMGFADRGISLVLSSNTTHQVEPAVDNLAFRTLTTVIFFSAIISLLYHLGIMQVLVRAIAWIMQRTMQTSGAETLSCAANIFVGQTEAPLLVKPFLKQMTRSELFAVMTGGFATIAGGVMALYAAMLKDVPGIMGHLLTASAMNAPAALVFAKIMCPETEMTVATDASRLRMERHTSNVLEAIANGTSDGLRLCANIVAMLMVFTGLIAMLNAGLAYCELWSLERMLGSVFRPVAWMLGIRWDEAEQVGELLGKRMTLNEFLAYQDLMQRNQMPDTRLSARTTLIASYALCGFANFASIGIQIGGIGAMEPARKSELSQLGFRSMLAGTCASFLTASIVGLLGNW